jgi:ElaB/YqjD/DUF883 family membrane-anchored ribosome-binding protein
MRIATCSLVAAGILAAGVGAQQMATPPAPPAPGQSAGFWGRGGAFNFTWPGPKSAELARKYANTKDEEARQETRKQLHDALTQEFDDNAKHQETELKELEKQIATLRKTLERRASHKSEIVDRRLEQLLQEADGMGWSSPNPYPSFGTGGMGGGFPVMPPPAASLPKLPKTPKPSDDNDK